MACRALRLKGRTERQSKLPMGPLGHRYRSPRNIFNHQPTFGFVVSGASGVGWTGRAISDGIASSPRVVGASAELAQPRLTSLLLDASNDVVGSKKTVGFHVGREGVGPIRRATLDELPLAQIRLRSRAGQVWRATRRARRLAVDVEAIARRLLIHLLPAHACQRAPR